MIRSNYLSKSILSGIFGLTVVFSGCSNHDKPTPQGAIRVDVEVVGATADTNSGRKYSGTVESADASTISFSVPGTISKIYVTDGQKVTKGQLLAQIKSESLVNSRNIAQAELEEARDAYRRLKKLHDADALPDIKWVEIQAKLKQAENAAALAERAVGDASVYSPINGYISQKFANEGQTVVPAEPIVKVVNLSNLQVAISVPENEISLFGPETTAKATFENPGNISVDGKIGHKGVVADPLTRSYSVKFDIDNPGGAILPGMTGSVTVEGLAGDTVAADHAEITLPSQAVLLASDNSRFVWTVVNGKAQRKTVVADELSANGVTVKSGLARGDTVIVAGMQKVGTGTPVTAIR